VGEIFIRLHKALYTSVLRSDSTAKIPDLLGKHFVSGYGGSSIMKK
jgi:hypothetical protein